MGDREFDPKVEVKPEGPTSKPANTPDDNAPNPTTASLPTVQGMISNQRPHDQTAANNLNLERDKQNLTDPNKTEIPKTPSPGAPGTVGTVPITTQSRPETNTSETTQISSHKEADKPPKAGEVKPRIEPTEQRNKAQNKERDQPESTTRTTSTTPPKKDSSENLNVHDAKTTTNPFEGAKVPPKGYRKDQNQEPTTHGAKDKSSDTPDRGKDSTKYSDQRVHDKPSQTQVELKTGNNTGKTLEPRATSSDSNKSEIKTQTSVERIPVKEVIATPSKEIVSAVGKPEIKQLTDSHTLLKPASEVKTLIKGEEVVVTKQDKATTQIIPSFKREEIQVESKSLLKPKEEVISPSKVVDPAQTQIIKPTKQDAKVIVVEPNVERQPIKQEISLPQKADKPTSQKDTPIPKQIPESKDIPPSRAVETKTLKIETPDQKTRIIPEKVIQKPEIEKARNIESIKERILSDIFRIRQVENVKQIDSKIKEAVREISGLDRSLLTKEEAALLKLRVRLISLLLGEKEAPQKIITPTLSTKDGVAVVRNSGSAGESAKFPIVAVMRVIEQASTAVTLAIKVLQGIESVEAKRALPQEALTQIKGIIQDLIRSTLPIGSDPDSITPEKIELLKSRIMQLLAQAKEELMTLDASGEALEDLIEVLEDLNQLELLEEQLLEELLALEGPHDFDEVLLEEHVELIKEVPEKEEDQVEEVLVITGRVIHKETNKPMSNLVVYGGLLGTCLTDELGEFTFINIPPGTFVTLGLDPEYISDPVIFQSVIEAHTTLEFRVMTK